MACCSPCLCYLLLPPFISYLRRLARSLHVLVCPLSETVNECKVFLFAYCTSNRLPPLATKPSTKPCLTCNRLITPNFTLNPPDGEQAGAIRERDTHSLYEQPLRSSQTSIVLDLLHSSMAHLRWQCTMCHLWKRFSR